MVNENRPYHKELTTPPTWFAKCYEGLLDMKIPETSLLSGSPGESWVEGLESACRDLLGVSVGDLNDYNALKSKILLAHSELSRALDQAETVLTRFGLVGLAQALKEFPKNSALDTDLIYLLRVIIPLVKFGLVSGGIPSQQMSISRIEEILIRINDFPTPASGGLWIEHTLAARIRTECRCAIDLMRLLGFDWVCQTILEHTNTGENEFYDNLDPKVFSSEGLQLLDVEKESARSHVVSADPGDNSDKMAVFKGSTNPSEDRRNKTLAKQAAVSRYLESEVYRRASDASTSYSDLPKASWNREGNVLKVAGWLELDFQNHRRKATLARVRAALDYTATNKERVFDLDLVQNLIREAEIEKIQAEKLARWKHDGFKRDPETFNALFAIAERGANGMYRINVRLAEI